MKPAAAARWRIPEPFSMALLGAAVGLPGGVLAVLLRRGVRLLFDGLAPFRAEAWSVFLPAAGALASIWILRGLFREPRGHGVGWVLDAVLRRGGYLPRRTIVSRVSAALVNVASGGSAGLEGPIVTSAGALGSAVATWLRMAERQRILLLGCGAAGGIAAVFNAPLTGLVFVSEVVLAEWSIASVVPVAVSATVATQVARHALGSEGAFQHPGFVYGAADLAACAPLGILAGLLSVALSRAIHGLDRQSVRLRPYPVIGRPWVRAAVAGVGVGAVGLALPGAIGEGYGTVARALGGELPAGLAALGLLLLGKFLATTLTLGSGTSGGIFAPALVIGSVLGSGFGQALQHAFPHGRFAAPGCFALVAMAGLVAGTMHAPLTGILLVLETTGGWPLSLPLILVAVVSAVTARLLEPWSFYTYELGGTGALARPGTDRRILADITAGEMLDAESASIEAGRTLEDLVALIRTTRRNHFAVVEPGSGRLLGMVDFSALRPFIFDEELRRVTTVDTVMDTSVPAVRAGDSLLAAMAAFERSGAWVLPVVREGVFAGTLSKSTLFDRYRQELIVQTAARE